MEIIRGKVYRYGDDVNTDVIFPGKYTYTVTDPDEMAKHAMEFVPGMENFVNDVRAGDIIVAGRNFGTGSSREHAMECLVHSGISCVVAESFARIFYRNAINLGLPILECSGISKGVKTGNELEVMADTGDIVNRTTGTTFKGRPLSGLERDIAGNFSVTHSADGATWKAVAGATPQNIQMGSTVYIGLAVTAHNADAMCEAVFSNVTTTGNVSGQWMHQDIGIASNATEPMYVAISSAAGTSATAAHDDPAAATIDTWTEWRIPLQALADQGMNLIDVDTIVIGLGSRAGATAAGGSGTMYFDDIRLYRPTPGLRP